MKIRTSPVTLITPLAAAIIMAACSNSSYSTSNNNPPTANVLIVSGAMNKTFTAFSPDTLGPDIS